jgi:uncharacterized membrane protein (DUF4010 family)
MGQQARKNPQILRPAVAGAVLSTVASVIQLGVVLAATNWQTLSIFRLSLIGAGLMAVVYGALLTFKSLRDRASSSMQVGRAFSLKATLMFASMIAVVQLLAAALNARFGSNGVIVGSALAGFADSHAPAVSVASLAASGKLDAHASVISILACVTTNTFTKMIVAIFSGGRRFGLQIIPGLILVILGAWAGAISTPLE